MVVIVAYEMLSIVIVCFMFLSSKAGARLTKHLKHKNFVSSIQFVWNLLEFLALVDK